MARIEWIPALGVGNKAIDDQHRQLFDLINRLDEAGESGAERRVLLGVAGELRDYVQVHFSLEESLFSGTGYPDKEPHIAEHRAFVAKVAGFQSAIIEGNMAVVPEMVGFLRSWLTRHIGLMDRKYRPYLADEGAEAAD